MSNVLASEDTDARRHVAQPHVASRGRDRHGFENARWHEHHLDGLRGSCRERLAPLGEAGGSNHEHRIASRARRDGESAVGTAQRLRGRAVSCTYDDRCTHHNRAARITDEP